MKKILIILLSFYSFVFSADNPTFSAWTSGACPFSYYDGPYFFYNPQQKDGSYAGNGGGENTYFLYPRDSGSICMYQYSAYVNSSTNNTQDYSYSKVLFDCSNGLVFDESSHSCVSSCPSGYKTDPNNTENCIPDCSTQKPVTVSAPQGWVKYENDYNSSIACKNQAVNDSHIYNDFSFSDITDSRGCYYSVCYINEFDPSHCIDENNPSDFLPNGYIFDGVASSEAVCADMVDGVYFLNYQVHNLYNNCSTKSDVLCYLKKGLDNNSSGVPLPDINSSNPDGTVSPQNNLPLDSNNSNVNHYDFNSSSQTNNLATQLSNNVRDFIGEFKKSDEYWKKDNNLKFNARTQNDNLNNQNMINAINSAKTDTSQVESKLDTLIGSTVDKSSQVLSDISNISLSDFNYSSSFDSNFSKKLGTDEISSIVGNSYSDFGDKATSAILSSINNIDYGVLDFFAVSDYSFQDYYLPDVHLMNATFNGKLMDANFLNALPWGYLKLALLLATLISSVIYILDRLF